MRVLFISTHNFATNPRLVKEIELAIALQYEVTVVCFEFGKWSKQLNDAIYQRLKDNIHYYPLAGDRSAGWAWLASSLLGKMAPPVLKLFPRSTFFQSVFSNKRSWLLLRKLHRVTTPVDLVVAHNAGSFYPAMRFALQRNIPYGIDLEDYHPGEGTGAAYAQYVKALLKSVLPGSAYLSAAAPLILSHSLAGLPAFTGFKRVVLNYFPAKEFLAPKPPKPGRLKMVWFSQQVSHGRGLEQVVPWIVQHSADMELHLFGNMNEAFYNEWLIDRDNIFVHGALPQVALNAALAEYDVGLAIENNTSNLNRELCLTNKLLSYFQAGLYVFCSATKAQEAFVKDHPGHGVITKLEAPSLAIAFTALVADVDSIRALRHHRFVKARLNSWEGEAEKLKECWKK